MKRLYVLFIFLAVANCLAKVTWTTSIDHEHCNFDVQVNEDDSVLYSETIHIPGRFMTTYEWGTSATACHINQNDESYVRGMMKNGTKTFLNKEEQICYFENMSFSTGNMGGFYYEPWSYIYSVNVRVSCEDSTASMYCAKTEKMARQVLLARENLACGEKGGSFHGNVLPVIQEDGSKEYCISATCDFCDSKWYNNYINNWKESECCINRGKEPNSNNGICESPDPLDTTKIGVFYSQIKELPGCSEITAGEDDGFCKLPQSSSSAGSSSSSDGSSSSGESSCSSENSSSSETESSSSFDKSSSSGESSSSTESSSSSEQSSSSDESSSSSEQSSSSEEYSSSNEESSSSEEYSSSSETGFCKSLPLDYIPSDPKNSCIESNGRCYRCNAARSSSECSSAWSWVTPWHIDQYYFTEIDCRSGERKDDNRIGQCPGFPMEMTPSNPEQTCVAYNGKCYKCNPARGSECANPWLWTGGSFGTHNIGYYYEQVDCYDPFGDEEDEGEFVENKQYACLVKNKNAALYKLTEEIPDFAKNNIKDQYEIDFSMLSIGKYDALGRNLKSFNSSYTKKHSFNRFLSLNRENGEIILLKNDVSNGEVDGRVEIKILNETVRTYTKGPLKGFALPDKNGNLIYHISAQIVVTILNVDYGNMDPLLVAHEKGHERIFKTIDDKIINVTVRVNKDLDNDAVCQKKKNAIWNAAKSIIKEMYNQQVAWDNNDVNNKSKHRINVNQTMNDLETAFKNAYKCDDCN